MKIAALISAATFVSFSALGSLHAQEPSDAIPSAEMESGTDSLVPPGEPAQIAPPTTPDEAGALEQTIYGEDEALDEAPAEPEAQSRPWKINLHALAGGYYDSNIFSSSDNRKPDFVSLLAAGAGVTLGDYTARKDNYLIFDYTAIGELFERHTDQDAYEQSASLGGQLLFGHLTLHGEFTLEDLADDNIDIGTRARRQIYTGLGSARYDISDKTFLEATAQIIVSHYDLYVGSNDERGGVSFNYLPDPNVVVGLGATGGVLNVDNASSQTYEQLLASLSVDATGKLSLKASAGVEDRQTSDNNGLITPVFEITGDYKPFQGLDFTLSAYRRVENSAYYVGSDYIATGIDAGAEYQVSARFSLLLNTGYMNSDYRDVSTGAGVSRNDNYFYVRPAFRYTASTYWNVQIYYNYRDNDSSLRTSSFRDTQAGVSINFTY